MEVMEKGRIYTSPLFVARVLDKRLEIGDKSIEKKLTTYSISVVAPKKILPTATKRNYMRRQIYEAVGMIKDDFKSIGLGAVSIIIFAKHEATKASIESMRSDLSQLFSKAKISV